MNKATGLLLIYTTHKNQKEAEVLAEKLLREKLIVCANIFPAGKSIYMWNGGINIDDEVIAIIKTLPEKLTDLQTQYLELHPYDTPCFVVIESSKTSAAYLEWANSTVD